jgi:hypothetical protein
MESRSLFLLMQMLELILVLNTILKLSRVVVIFYLRILTLFWPRPFLAWEIFLTFDRKVVETPHGVQNDRNGRFVK